MKREEISGSEFLSSVQELFGNYDSYVENSSCTAEKPKIKAIPKEPIADIVCYGIGKLSSCPIARYQFAFLLLLKELLQLTGLCFIYEPHFSQDDKIVVKEFGSSLIEHNEEGKRKVESLTLFFMLHCGKPLYNSVLWANWGPGLSNVVILGNRFTSYQERLPSRQLRDEAPYIYNILPYMIETPIPNTFHHSDIFNDSAVHWFPNEMLAKVPHAVWKDNVEPVYDQNDPEIVTTNGDASV
ncbi:SRR1-like protein isoform X3 [Oculina patagonica]